MKYNAVMADFLTTYHGDHRFLLQNDSPFAVSNPQKRVVTIITLFFSCVALLASILILVLIRRLRVWNPQTSLVWWMSVCQCTYDASFFSFVAQASGSTNHWSYYTASFFQLFGGISVTLFTNVITAVLMWVIISRKNIDLFRYFHWVLLITMGPGLAIGIAYLANKTDDAYLGEVLSPSYYWVRLGSIFLNLLFYVITQDRVNKITNSVSVRAYSTGAGGADGNRKKLSTHDAIATLTRRSKYYWIVQAISRSGAAVYEGAYGYHGYTGFTNTNQYVGALFFAVLTPSASIGYLTIFLHMQPRAFESFKSLFLVEIPDFIMCRHDRVIEAAIRESASVAPHGNSKTMSRAGFENSRNSLGGPNSLADASSKTRSDDNATLTSLLIPGTSPSEHSGNSKGEGEDISGTRSTSHRGGTSTGTTGAFDDRPLPPVKSPVISPSHVQTPYPPNAVVSPATTAGSTAGVPGGGSWRAALQRTLGSDMVASVARFGHDAHSVGGLGLRRNFGSGNIQDLNSLEDDELFDIIHDNDQEDVISALTELSRSSNPVQGKLRQSMSSVGELSIASNMTDQSDASVDPYDFEYSAPSI